MNDINGLKNEKIRSPNRAVGRVSSSIEIHDHPSQFHDANVNYFSNANIKLGDYFPLTSDFRNIS